MSRGKIRFAALISAIFVLFINICAFAKVDIPNHTDRFFINDYANVIDSETEDYIFEKGKAYNANGGPQVVVLTMESIDGNDLEDFSIETARKWGIGDKDADNGVLILLVMDSRDIRIEVGYGLEGVLNDGKCGRFIRNATDSLSAGDYSEGIKQIYDSVIGELEDPTPDEEDDDDTMVEIMTYVVFFIVLAIVVFITNIKGRGGRGGGKAGIPGGNNASNFMVGSLGGVTSANGLGLNYVDQWGKKLKVTGSYFFNQSDNLTQQQTDREYFESVLPGMTYNEYQENSMKNWNHRFNMKLDYQMTERTSLQFRPTLSFQNNDTYGLLQGQNLVNGITDNETETSSFGKNNAYNVGADLMLRHRFLKEGRTLSLMLSGKMSNTDGDTYTDYLNTLYGLEISPATESYSQWKQTLNQQYSLRSNLNYTEKLTDNLQLQLGYKMSYTDSENDKKTYNHSAVTDLYDQLDESLSNEYQSGYLTQAGNVGLRYRAGKLSAMLGVDAQWANLKGDLVYPQPDELSHKYFSLLPSFTLRYSVDRNNSFQLRYRSKSSSPSVTNLQNVIDNSNPLFLSTGNPNLDQQVSHTANLRYLRTTKSGQTFIAMVGATIQQDYVADSTFVAREDIALSPTVTLNKGSQFTRPVNLDGYYSLQSMLTYGFPVDFIRSNINLSLSANYANVPTIFDGIESRTRELNLIPKIIIGSNISKNLDFTASYSAGINKMFSSLDNTAGSDYVTHTAAAKLGWTFFWGLTFRSTFNYIGYTGLDTGTEDYFLWNLSLGKKFLKNNAAEIRIEAFDVLKQNQAFTHRTGSNYYDYVSSNVLQPYAMISFVYTIR